MHEDVDKLVLWLSERRLIVNSKKTKSIIISRNKTTNFGPIIVNNEPIEQVDHIKILGVVFNSTTKWDDQFKAIWIKCCRSFSIVRRLWIDGCPAHIVQLAYMGLVFSNISFCWPVICDLPINLFNKFVKQYELLMK